MRMKITDVAPAYCASCFDQKPGMLHVDFGAAFDGPVIDSGNGMKQCIDDLIVCADCLDTAARLAGYLPAAEAQATAEIEKLTEQLSQVKKIAAERGRKLRSITSALEDANLAEVVPIKAAK